MKVLILAAALAALHVQHSSARTLTVATRSTAAVVTAARGQVVRSRLSAWYWQARAGVPRSPTVYAERRSTALPYLHYLTAKWAARAVSARHAAATPTDGAPAWFVAQAECVHSREGAWTVVDPPFYGGLQFELGTWERAGGRGSPAAASPAEQIDRAYVIYRQDGGSWREWPNTARACGLL